MAEYKLSFTAQEIDNTLKHALLFSEQNLTEEQQTQVKRNLGLLDNVSDEPSSSTGFKYTYDGDNVDLTKTTWLYTPSGNPVFAKVGEVPENGLDLAGSEVAVCVPEWPHMSYKFTITSKMLKEQITVLDNTLHATIEGLTQIFYQNTGSNDYTPNTMLLICTIPGTYTVAMNGWTERFQIVQTGIYFLDNRSEWGGKYTESLTWYEPNEEEEEEEDVFTNNFGNEIQMFSRGLCIGDSITEGVFNYNGGQTVIKKYSYPTVLQRMTGIDIVNAGIGGLTAQTWYEASLNSETQYGRWINNEWIWHVAPEVGENDIVSTTLDYSNFDFSIIHLGINDIYLMNNTTLEDTIINFESNINNIIN